MYSQLSRLLSRQPRNNKWFWVVRSRQMRRRSSLGRRLLSTIDLTMRIYLSMARCVFVFFRAFWCRFLSNRSRFTCFLMDLFALEFVAALSLRSRLFVFVVSSFIRSYRSTILRTGWIRTRAVATFSRSPPAVTVRFCSSSTTASRSTSRCQSTRLACSPTSSSSTFRASRSRRSIRR